MHKPIRSIWHRKKSFRYAFNGLWYLISSQINAKIHLSIAIIVIIAGFLLKITQIEWIVVILLIGLVFSAEAFNTSIERFIDLVSPEYHQAAKNSKDLAAAGVLICAILAAIIGLILFLPKIIKLIFT